MPHVKDGEMAVFVYKQYNGTQQDFIIGPYNDTIKTYIFPVLTSVGALLHFGKLFELLLGAVVVFGDSDVDEIGVGCVGFEYLLLVA